MSASIRNRVEVCELDLDGRVVVTEAATGAYASTAAAAALAGATVHTLAASNSFGTAVDSITDVELLLSSMDVDPAAVSFYRSRADLPVGRADIITNSGMLRPIDAHIIDRLPDGAAIALMYEAWEARAGDIDYQRAAMKHIPVVAVDEHHPACGAFEFVGDLVIAAARARRIPLTSRRIGVLSDNPFGPVIRERLDRHGSIVVELGSARDGTAVDVLVVATTPGVSVPNGTEFIDGAEAARIALATGAASCIQLWGDLDRETLEGLTIEPEVAPRPGYQGVPMSAAGPEPVIRLQVAGIAAVVHRFATRSSAMYGLSQDLSMAWSPEAM